ncbi:MAG: hypothetical protein Q8J74_13685 [Candidatus Didemnitutus sp.]|nr:hypothetical protein [Candidatus Didemnitutus sp.]
MAFVDPVLFRELPVIQKIIADEIWLEGERRGRPVPVDDPVVREQVCTIILRIGAELRTALTAPEDGDAVR